MTPVWAILFLSHCQSASVAPVGQVPSHEPLSRQFTVKVDKNDVPVYLARVVALTSVQRERLQNTAALADTRETSFASFDIGGSFSVSVTCPELIQKAKILPSSSGIMPVIVGKSVTFTVSKPGQLTLEVNGDWISSLHLFANPLETDVPRPGDPNVIYFGPGIHEVESVKVDSGKTVYLANGAVLYGKDKPGNPGSAIFVLNGSNIVLRGRGIIDGSLLQRSSPVQNILSAQGTNIRVEGVVLRDSPSWNFPVNKSDQVKIQNIKVFGWRGNSDGIDICNSRQVEVSDCFLRTFDDLVVVKSSNKKGGESRDITVKNCVLWNEFAHALSLGAELRLPVENILFTQCNVIHDMGREFLLRVFNCDSAAVKNIVFDNIRIDESRRLMSLWIGKTVWSKEAERGHINEVTFRNISSVQPQRPGPFADLKGFDAGHAIQGVQFDHVIVAGRALKVGDVKQNGYVQGVGITP